MQGVDRHTGQSLGGLAHLRQSIVVLLTTRIGTRVMRRDYGCGLWQFIDAPMTPRTFALMYERIAVAIDLWEPRVELLSCNIDKANIQGQLWLSMNLRLKQDIIPKTILNISAAPQHQVQANSDSSSSSNIIINNTPMQQQNKIINGQAPNFVGNGTWVLADIPIQGTLKLYINGQRVDIKGLQNNILQVDFDFDPDEDVMRVDYSAVADVSPSTTTFNKNDVLLLDNLILN